MNLIASTDDATAPSGGKFQCSADPGDQESTDLKIIESGTDTLLKKIRGDEQARGQMKECGTERMNYGKMARGIPREHRSAIAFDHPVATRS
jgi:hypothetical protein